MIKSSFLFIVAWSKIVLWPLLDDVLGLGIIPGWLASKANLGLQVPLGFQHRQYWVAALSFLHVLGNRVSFIVVLNLVLVVLRSDTLSLLVLGDVRLGGHLVVLLVLNEH